MDCRDCDCYPLDSKHEARCEFATTTITKAAFVDAAESAARGALDSYQILTLDMDISTGTAIEMAIDETRESASCYMGIGSCGGGGCKHA